MTAASRERERTAATYLEAMSPLGLEYDGNLI